MHEGDPRPVLLPARCSDRPVRRDGLAAAVTVSGSWYWEDGMMTTDRLAELATNLAAVRARIAGACAPAGRDPAEVQLIAVTKTFPVPDIMLLARLGVTDVGENKDQEAAPKVAE